MSIYTAFFLSMNISVMGGVFCFFIKKDYLISILVTAIGAFAFGFIYLLVFNEFKIHSKNFVCFFIVNILCQIIFCIFYDLGASRNKGGIGKVIFVTILLFLSVSNIKASEILVRDFTSVGIDVGFPLLFMITISMAHVISSIFLIKRY